MRMSTPTVRQASTKPAAATVLPDATTTDGALLVLAIVLPVAGVLLSLALGGRHVERIAFVLLPSGFGVAFVIFADVWRSGHRLIYIVGDWQPPLGIALRADGLSAAMMVTMAIVICAVGVFAHADFGTRAGSAETRAPFAFWILLMAVWGAMNMVFLGGDLFTLYVALELLTFAAVPLVCLDGRAETGNEASRAEAGHHRRADPDRKEPVQSGQFADDPLAAALAHWCTILTGAPSSCR